jgi:hypothetical protein
MTGIMRWEWIGTKGRDREREISWLRLEIGDSRLAMYDLGIIFECQEEKTGVMIDLTPRDL